MLTFSLVHSIVPGTDTSLSAQFNKMRNGGRLEGRVGTRKRVPLVNHGWRFGCTDRRLGSAAQKWMHFTWQMPHRMQTASDSNRDCH
jgi:hypothetical protein